MTQELTSETIEISPRDAEIIAFVKKIRQHLPEKLPEQNAF